MKELKFKSLKPFLIVCLIAMLSIGCESPPEKTIDNIKNNVYLPREYYLNNHGLKTSGKQLRDFYQICLTHLPEVLIGY